MEITDLSTKIVNTWCPGCFNFALLLAIKKALVELVNEKKVKKENLVAVTGIGCHAKIYDYLNLNGYYSLHGRVLPVAWGMKLANLELSVIGFGGDGDTYAEGIAHLIQACRTNPDLMMVVHNNQVFALTTGQATPTTEKGYLSKSTPILVAEKPLNPLALSLLAGASFVARGSVFEGGHLKELFKKGIEHPGFALIDVLDPCISYHDDSEFIRKHTYRLGKDNYSFQQALDKTLEWDYQFHDDAKIPLGIFYQEKRPVWESQRPDKKPFYQVERKRSWTKLLAEFKTNL